ncbi:MAG: GspE/PulE family protein [Verrucomicrobiales bacterium]|nr:GspE/PulE family protein [Verrucomicrobiales bacterium]
MKVIESNIGRRLVRPVEDRGDGEIVLRGEGRKRLEGFDEIVAGAAAAAGGGEIGGVLEAERGPGGGGSVLWSLLDAGVVGDEELFYRELAGRLGMRLVDEIGTVAGAGEGLPLKVALRHRVLPALGADGVLRLLTSDPFDADARRAVGQAKGRGVAVRWELVPRDILVEGLRAVYGVGAATFDDLVEGRDGGDGEDAMAQEVTVLQEDEEATVMGFVNQIFREALDERATDIHIEPLENNLRIRCRVDGALQEIRVPADMRLLQASLVSRLKIMAHLDIAERRLPQDGRINLELDGQRIDVRVATIPSVNGESVSLRILSRESFDLAALGLDERMEAKVKELLALPNGIILVTGPTGSGKSTTLYTFLRQLNTEERRIVTIEDPVEHKLDGVVQIAVKPEIKLTFAAGLRSILRGDPNVIMVGEMRDLETTEIAVRGALTGHLVFSTLHTNDAVGGISRLLDMGVEPFLIASSVRCFLAQRLVRRLCEECSRPADEHQHHDPYLESIGFPVEERGKVRAAVGCRACRGTGYRGRLAIMELCVVSNGMQDLIANGAGTSALRAKAREEGMLNLREHGWMRVVQGKTTIEEVLAVTAGD